MDVIYLAFANSRTEPLLTLQEEDNALYKTLSPRQLKQHFILNRDSYATIGSVSQFISQSRDQLRLFLYSGHAGRDKLMLEGQSANAEGIAHLLGQCRNLKLVFLNGCSTFEQVKGLLAKGVPAVLATSAPIDDRKATDFSLRFFQALNDQSTIKEAFELAKGEILLRHKDVRIDIHNILAEPGAGDNGESLWGLYINPGKEEVMNWKLPFQTVVAGMESFVPNVLLIDTLIESLAPYREEVKKILEEESLGATKSILDKREAILKAIPHPVSEQLRKLLVDDEASEGGLTFFHKVGPDRLVQITVIYNTLMELLGYTVLAQLWEVAKKEGFHISEEHRTKLRGFFNASVIGRSANQFFDLIGIVRSVLAENKATSFIEEMNDLSNVYNENSELREAINYLEQINQKLAEKSVDPGEANEMCVIAEQKLAQLLKHLGFLANYTLLSIKSIDILNYAHFTVAKFKHRMVKLEQRFVGLAENQEIADKALTCNSILIVRNGDEKRFLNLSPFVIDENAFDDKASIAKLYFFDSYDKASNAYAFRHVYKPADSLLKVEQQKHFQILKAQFDSFAKSVFNQPMQTL
ncbi:MAG TPA: CHAT domain-containing protein [Saprospiraceae bacterium]|nr:CHAT domain-containing protein [Saprospiraceae bacterium]